jgi:hypothetical protein
VINLVCFPVAVGQGDFFTGFQQKFPGQFRGRVDGRTALAVRSTFAFGVVVSTSLVTLSVDSDLHAVQFPWMKGKLWLRS